MCRQVIHHHDLAGLERWQEHPLDVGLKTSRVVLPTTARHGPIPSSVMLASRVVFLPRLRGTFE
jgi:hypothetical protein